MTMTIYKMEQLSESTLASYNLDYLLIASGSDHRAYEILSKYRDSSKCRKICFHFNERVSGLSYNDTLFDYKKYEDKLWQNIYCGIKDPSSCLEGILTNIFKSSDRIAIDISCFTKPYFYFIIKLLKERCLITNIIAFYTEPQSYLFSKKGLFNTFHASSGPLSIMEIPGYSGQEDRGTERKLVILIGFEGDLSREINEDVSPISTIVVNGFPSYTTKCKDISLIANEKLISDHGVRKQYARANNPFEVYNLLQSIRRSEGSNSFINIAPLGTKPMALGACLFALHNPDVRVVHPLPDKYEDKYSDMCWNSWAYYLPLNIA